MGFVLLLLLLMILNGVYQNYFVSADTNVSLAVAVHNISGYAMPQGGGTITVVLFNSNYQKIIEKSNEYRGGETLVNIFLGTFPAGNYIVEVYNIPKTGLRYHEFWGSDFVKADGTPKHFYRHVPYVIDVKVNGKSVYDGLTTITYGNSVSMEVLVKNADPETKNVKVRLLLRKCGSTSYWFNEISDQKSISGGGISSFKFVINPQETGIHEFYVIVFGWNNARIITDQHNWYKAFEVKAPEVEDAEIIKFKPPSGEFKPGDELISDVMIRNTGTVTRSFWIGLSYRSPDGTWYDVPPEETRVLSPGQETTITFKWRLPADAPYGFYDAKAAIWNGYDPKNNIMIPPQYDEAYEEDVFKVVMPSHNVEVQLIYPQNGEIMKDLPIMFIVRILVDGKPAEGVRVELICTNGGTSYCHPIDDERFHYTDSEGYVRVQCFSSLGPGSTVKWYAKALYQGEEYRSETWSFTFRPETEDFEVDIYTDKGGQGYFVPGGTYYVGEYGEVYFKANRKAYVCVYEEYPGGMVTLYEGWIEGNKVYRISGRYQEPPGDRLFVIKAEDEYGNEAYDECKVEVISQTPYLPDLIITSIKIHSSEVYRGEKLTIEFTEKNQGNGDSGPFVTKIYLGKTEYGRDYVIGDTGSHTLKAGESRKFKLDLIIPKEIPTGNYYVVIFIDYSDQIKESNEDNNIKSTAPNVIQVRIRSFIADHSSFQVWFPGLQPPPHAVYFSLDYCNTLDEDVIVVFYIEDVEGNVISVAKRHRIFGDPIAKANSRGRVYGEWIARAGTFYIEWKAFLVSDKNLSNPIDASLPEEKRVIKLAYIEGMPPLYHDLSNFESRERKQYTIQSFQPVQVYRYFVKAGVPNELTIYYSDDFPYVLAPIYPTRLNPTRYVYVLIPRDIKVSKYSVVGEVELVKTFTSCIQDCGTWYIFKVTANKQPAWLEWKVTIKFNLINPKTTSSVFIRSSSVSEIIAEDVLQTAYHKFVELIFSSLKSGSWFSPTDLATFLTSLGFDILSAHQVIIFDVTEQSNYIKVGDVDGDNVVDYKDLAILGANYGKHQSDPDFNSAADLNGDGVVDYKDLAILGANYEKS